MRSMLSEVVIARVSAEQRARLDALAHELGRSIGEIVRVALSATTTVPLCPVCERPRRADGVEDAMAHAQCHQILTGIEEQP